METELAIVGSGPAGLAAAIEAAKIGVKVTIIDENPRPGVWALEECVDTAKFFEQLKEKTFQNHRKGRKGNISPMLILREKVRHMLTQKMLR